MYAARITLSIAIMVGSVTRLSAQTIRGHLLDGESGVPIDLGLVILLTEAGDSITYSLTDRHGYFSITSAEPGSFRLVGSGLGYEERTAGVFDLGMGGDISVRFHLSPAPLVIDELLVSLDRPALEHKLVRNGFVRRYQRDLGGIFLTPHDIERSPARSTESLFLGLPGVRVRQVSNEARGPLGYVGDVVLMERPWGQCRPTIYVDGVRMHYAPDDGVTLSSYVPLTTVQAVEVYRRDSEIPIEYNATRSGRDELCGVLVFWTG